MTYRTSLLLACLLTSTAVFDVAAQQPATTTSTAQARVLDQRRMQPVSGDA
ncbi:hypothetical protein HFP05_08380, partial [Rhodanobacter denitrificans]|nr:hypothetical protein [Rhodanobacter denitrificans]